MRSGKRLVLAHEMPGIHKDGRHAVEFNTFFAADQTPDELIQAGIYSTIAVPLKRGAWREVSMALLAKELTETAKATNYAFGASAQDIRSVTTAVTPGQTFSRRVSRPEVAEGVSHQLRARLRLGILLQRWRPPRARGPRPQEPAQLLITGGLPSSYRAHIGMDDGESAPTQELT